MYLFDRSDRKKRAHCKKLLRQLEEEHIPVISDQVVKEVCAVLLRKFNYPVAELKPFLTYLENYEVVNTSIPLVTKSLDIVVANQLSFWDALICSAADEANCALLLTEDMNDGQKILGVRIQNPFD
ncbi:MAG: putative nucleic acid-binding protein [Bacteroidia bacterium]